MLLTVILLQFLYILCFVYMFLWCHTYMFNSITQLLLEQEGHISKLDPSIWHRFYFVGPPCVNLRKESRLNTNCRCMCMSCYILTAVGRCVQHEHWPSPLDIVQLRVLLLCPVRLAADCSTVRVAGTWPPCLYYIHYYTFLLYTGWAKNQTVLRVDNFVMVNEKKSIRYVKVLKFCL